MKDVVVLSDKDLDKVCGGFTWSGAAAAYNNPLSSPVTASVTSSSPNNFNSFMAQLKALVVYATQNYPQVVFNINVSNIQVKDSQFYGDVSFGVGQSIG